MGAPDVTINVGMLMTKEVNYKGSFRYGVSPSFKAVHDYNIGIASPAITLLRSNS